MVQSGSYSLVCAHPEELVSIRIFAANTCIYGCTKTLKSCHGYAARQHCSTISAADNQKIYHAYIKLLAQPPRLFFNAFIIRLDQSQGFSKVSWPLNKTWPQIFCPSMSDNHFLMTTKATELCHRPRSWEASD
jgi:hypothetical protein